MKKEIFIKKLISQHQSKNKELPGGWLVEVESRDGDSNPEIKNLIELKSNSSLGISRELDKKLNKISTDQTTSKPWFYQGL